jgi:hypothetical protein
MSYATCVAQGLGGASRSGSVMLLWRQEQGGLGVNLPRHANSENGLFSKVEEF